MKPSLKLAVAVPTLAVLTGILAFAQSQAQTPAPPIPSLVEPPIRLPDLHEDSIRIETLAVKPVYLALSLSQSESPTPLAPFIQTGSRSPAPGMSAPQIAASFLAASFLAEAVRPSDADQEEPSGEESVALELTPRPLPHFNPEDGSGRSVLERRYPHLVKAQPRFRFAPGEMSTDPITRKPQGFNLFSWRF